MPCDQTRSIVKDVGTQQLPRSNRVFQAAQALGREKNKARFNKLGTVQMVKASSARVKVGVIRAGDYNEWSGRKSPVLVYYEFSWEVIHEKMLEMFGPDVSSISFEKLFEGLEGVERPAVLTTPIKTDVKPVKRQKVFTRIETDDGYFFEEKWVVVEEPEEEPKEEKKEKKKKEDIAAQYAAKLKELQELQEKLMAEEYEKSKRKR